MVHRNVEIRSSRLPGTRAFRMWQSTKLSACSNLFLVHKSSATSSASYSLAKQRRELLKPLWLLSTRLRSAARAAVLGVMFTVAPRPRRQIRVRLLARVPYLVSYPQTRSVALNVVEQPLTCPARFRSGQRLWLLAASSAQMIIVSPQPNRLKTT